MYWIVCVLYLEWDKVGNNIAARMVMMVIIISNSINVNLRARVVPFGGDITWSMSQVFVIFRFKARVAVRGRRFGGD